MINLTDPVAILRHLFLAEALRCPPARTVASDANGSGNVDLADAVYLLEFLFRAGDAPLAPFAACKPVPGFDDTGCLDASCRIEG